MKAVILQPSYLPWRGYFHQIAKADLFIFYDDVQYDKHGWRNRNRIKTHQGPQWITVPVYSSGAPVQHTPINQILIDWKLPWNRKHWASIQQAYRKAPYFEQYAGLLEPFYSQHYDKLCDLDIDTTICLARALGIEQTRFMRSSEVQAEGAKTDRLISILTQVGCTHYISGPAAKDYIEAEKFERAGISLEYMVYNYPEYPQLYPPFDPQVSVVDALFMLGPAAFENIIGAGATLG